MIATSTNSSDLRWRITVQNDDKLAISYSSDGGKTYNFMTDSQGQPISSGGPTFETLAENIQRAGQSAAQ